MRANLLKQMRIHGSLLASICWDGFSVKGAVAEVIASSVSHPEGPTCPEAVESCPVPTNTNAILNV